MHVIDPIEPIRVIEDGFAYWRLPPGTAELAYTQYTWTIQARRCRVAVEAVLADPAVELYFNFGPAGRHLGDHAAAEQLSARKAWVIGPHTHTLLVSKEIANCDMIGVRLAPAVAVPLLGVPAAELEGSLVDLDLLWKGGVESLRDRLGEEQVPTRRMALLERALRERLAGTIASDELVRVRQLCERVGAPVPEMSLGRLAAAIGVSHRRLIAIFHRQVGLKPKTYHRVMRLRRVFRLVVARPELSWAQVAIEAGYSDQAHFANEFKRMTGVTASDYAARRSWVGEGVLPYRLAATAAGATPSTKG